ncbi:MAG: nitrous oxide reductase family maturation protein NosD [Planctomycetes bacterium]|nr:nitrous oxide reductase family maturation protein NosD [Planctomycetota bacterium]
MTALLPLVPLLAFSAAALQSLLDAAPPGSVVVPPPGVYEGRIVLTKPLTINGRGVVTIDGRGSGTLVSVTGVAVTLRGVVLRGSGDDFTGEDSAVKLENADGCVLEDCTIEDALFGLYIAHSSHCSFRRLSIRGKALPIPRRGDGVRLWYSDDTTLEDVSMSDSRDFIIWFAHRTLVRNCRVARSRYGLHYMYCEDNRFEGNVFVDNQVGGTIMYSRRISLTGNRFERSRGPSAYGLLLKDADDIVADGNEFVDNTRGIYFDNSPQSEEASCLIARNLFALNDAGVSILPDTRRVRFEGNSFVDNVTQAELLGHGDSSKNTWEGNYWSGHVAYDEDGDGVSDLPYVPESLYEDLVGRHPELALLRQGPSVAALEMAGRLFPLVRGERTLEDARPAMRPTVRPLPRRGAEERSAAVTGVCTMLLRGCAVALVAIPLFVAAWSRRYFR